MEKTNQTLSDFIDWVELSKAPPGPPPRPGLEWRDRTSRWIRPKTGKAVVEDSPSSEETDEAGIHIHAPIELDPEVAAHLETQLQEFESIYSSVMTSLTELFSGADVSGRVKTLEGIAVKIKKKGFSGISELTDVVGTRIEFTNMAEVEEAISEIEQRFTIREKEYHFQKDGYYTAAHLILEVETKPVEVQIRTTVDGKIAQYAHDVIYKESANFAKDTGLMDTLHTYLVDWNKYARGMSELPPDCPDPIRIVLGCLEDMAPEGQQELNEGSIPDQAQGIEAMLEKNGVEDFKAKIFELIHRITAPKGKYRLIEVDEFSDPFETGDVINDFVFLEEAQQEQSSMQKQNPTVKYFIYDEDSKVVEQLSGS